VTRSYPPKAQYNLAQMETLILEVVATLDPVRLSATDLMLKIVSDSDDDREIETAGQAIRSLREFGVLVDRNDEIVELIPAVLHTCTLVI
jgi:hypothetical protein